MVRLLKVIKRNVLICNQPTLNVTRFDFEHIKIDKI